MKFMTLHPSSLPTKEENTCATCESITFFTEEPNIGVECSKEALSSLENCNNPEQTIFKLVIFQILSVYFRSLNDYSSASKFYDKALLECSGS